MASAAPPKPTGDGKLTIQILDVGQGDGIYIEFPNGKNMLVDLGSLMPTKAWKVVRPDLWTYFATHTRFKNKGATLDYLVVTHADFDHYSLIPQFVAQFTPTIRYVLHAGVPADYKNEAFRKLLNGWTKADADRAKATATTTTGPSAMDTSTSTAPTGPVMLKPPPVPIFPLAGTAEMARVLGLKAMSSGNQNDLCGGVGVLVLAINTKGISKKADSWQTNTASVVLQLRFGEENVILAGDATTDTEAAILNALGPKVGILKSTVLKVAHHGSARTSSRPAWIKAVAPEYVVVSSDRNGTSSASGTSGFRLPQELCLDIIRQNTKLRPAVSHPYVSAYDPNDYDGYVNPDVKGATAGLAVDLSKKTLRTGGGTATTTATTPTPTTPTTTTTTTTPQPSARPATTLILPAFPAATTAPAPAPPRPPRQWYQATTTEGIFTTLAVMDAKSPDDVSDADQGVQYQIKITAEGAVSIDATTDLAKLIALSNPATT